MSSPPELVEGAFALFLFPSFRYFDRLISTSLNASQ